MRRELVLPSDTRMFEPTSYGSTNLLLPKYSYPAGTVLIVDDLVEVGWDHNVNLAFKVIGVVEAFVLAEEVDREARQPTSRWMQAYEKHNAADLAKYRAEIMTIMMKHMK